MNFEALPLPGAFRITLEKKADARGHFARTFCVREFSDHGLNASLLQCSTSFNRNRATLRGLHWQAAPHGEAKLVRATRGSLWDVMVDLRPESPTFRQWHGETLDEDNGIMLYIPDGFAHGFVTLRENTELFYQMTTSYDAASARGARFDDPAFNIAWPVLNDLIISDRDLAFPVFNPASPEV
jgi:dTDP-4-dehydrorhamnose 3,5-epimerase